tara:strand:+ start:10052 stop:20314 length:10263 start_codon:yes stop_codon:yes gene_type:complete
MGYKSKSGKEYSYEQIQEDADERGLDVELYASMSGLEKLEDSPSSTAVESNASVQTSTESELESSSSDFDYKSLLGTQSSKTSDPLLGVDGVASQGMDAEQTLNLMDNDAWKVYDVNRDLYDLENDVDMKSLYDLTNNIRVENPEVPSFADEATIGLLSTKKRGSDKRNEIIKIGNEKYGKYGFEFSVAKGLLNAGSEEDEKYGDQIEMTNTVTGETLTRTSSLNMDRLNEDINEFVSNADNIDKYRAENLTTKVSEDYFKPDVVEETMFKVANELNLPVSSDNWITSLYSNANGNISASDHADFLKEVRERLSVDAKKNTGINQYLVDKAITNVLNMASGSEVQKQSLDLQKKLSAMDEETYDQEASLLKDAHYAEVTDTNDILLRNAVKARAEVQKKLEQFVPGTPQHNALITEMADAEKTLEYHLSITRGVEGSTFFNADGSRTDAPSKDTFDLEDVENQKNEYQGLVKNDKVAFDTSYEEFLFYQKDYNEYLNQEVTLRNLDIFGRHSKFLRSDRINKLVKNARLFKLDDDGNEVEVENSYDKDRSYFEYHDTGGDRQEKYNVKVSLKDLVLSEYWDIERGLDKNYATSVLDAVDFSNIKTFDGRDVIDSERGFLGRDSERAFLQGLKNDTRDISIKNSAWKDLMVFNLDAGSYERENVFTQGIIEAVPYFGGRDLVEDTFGWHTDDYAIKDQSALIDDVNTTVESINILAKDDPTFSNQDYINYQPVEFSEKQLDNLSMSFGEEVAYGVGSFVPMLGEFAIVNAVTAGTLGSLGLMSRINSLRKAHYVSNTLYGTGKKARGVIRSFNAKQKAGVLTRAQMQKRALAAGYNNVDDFAKVAGYTAQTSKLGGGLHLLTMALVEEGKMKLMDPLFDVQMPTGSGVGFYVGGHYARKFMPFQFKGNAGAILNPLLNNNIKGGIGGSVAAETALNVEAAWEDVTGHQAWRTHLEENYFNEEGELTFDKFQKRMTLNALQFGILGFTPNHWKASDLKMSMRSKQAYHNQLEGKIRTALEKGDVNTAIKFQELKDYSVSQYKALQSREKYLDPAVHAQDIKVRFNKFNKSFAKQHDGKRSFEYVVVHTDKGVSKLASHERLGKGEPAKMIEKDVNGKKLETPKIILDVRRFNAGIMPHEIFHAVLHSLPEAHQVRTKLAEVIRKNVDEKFKKYLQDLKLEGETLSDRITKEYSAELEAAGTPEVPFSREHGMKAKRDLFNEEFSANVIELMGREGGYDMFVHGNILGDIRTSLRDAAFSLGLYDPAKKLDINDAASVTRFMGHLAKQWGKGKYNKAEIDALVKKLEGVEFTESSIPMKDGFILNAGKNAKASKDIFKEQKELTEQREKSFKDYKENKITKERYVEIVKEIKARVQEIVKSAESNKPSEKLGSISQEQRMLEMQANSNKIQEIYQSEKLSNDQKLTQVRELLGGYLREFYQKTWRDATYEYSNKEQAYSRRDFEADINLELMTMMNMVPKKSGEARSQYKLSEGKPLTMYIMQNLPRRAVKLLEDNIGKQVETISGYEDVKTGVLDSGPNAKAKGATKSEYYIEDILLKPTGDKIITLEQNQRIDNTFGKIDTKKLESKANLRETAPEVTNEIFMLASGKPRSGVAGIATKKLKKILQEDPIAWQTNPELARLKFLIDNVKKIHDKVLPEEGAMLKTGIEAIEGLSSQISPAIMDGKLYQATSRKVSEGAKASTAITGKTQGLKVQEKKSLTARQILEYMGIDYNPKTGEVNVSRLESQSVEARVIEGFMGEFGRELNRQRLQIAVNNGTAPKNIAAKYEVNELLTRLKAGKAEGLKGKDIFNDTDVRALEVYNKNMSVGYGMLADIKSNQELRALLGEAKTKTYIAELTKIVKKNFGTQIELFEKEGVSELKEVEGKRYDNKIASLIEMLPQSIRKLYDVKNLDLNELGEKVKVGVFSPTSRGEQNKFDLAILDQYPASYAAESRVRTAFGQGSKDVAPGLGMRNKSVPDGVAKGPESWYNIHYGRVPNGKRQGERTLSENALKAQMVDMTVLKVATAKVLNEFGGNLKEGTKKYDDAWYAVRKAITPKGFKSFNEYNAAAKEVRAYHMESIANVLLNPSKFGLTHNQALKGALYHLRLQTNLGKGVVKGSAVPTSVASFLPGKIKNTDLYGEHQLQLLNHSFTFLQSVLSRGKNWTKDYDRLESMFEQSITATRDQKIYDSPAFDGNTGFLSIFKNKPLGLTSSFVNNMYRPNMMFDMMDMTASKPMSIGARYIRDFTAKELKSVIKITGMKNQLAVELNSTIKQESAVEANHVKLTKITGSKSKDIFSGKEVAKHMANLGKVQRIARLNKEARGISVWDFDDTLAFSKSGVRYNMPNPSGKPQPGRKVIFMAGAPGAGKSTVIKGLDLLNQGFKIVNQDIALERLMKESGMPTDMREMTSEDLSNFSRLSGQARRLAGEKRSKYTGKGQGMIVDGTGASLKVMEKAVKEFKDAGYDAQMVFVETTMETAVTRNKARKERSLKTGIVKGTWEKVIANKEAYREMFGERFAEVKTDNIQYKDAMPAELVKKLDSFTKGYIRGRLNAGGFAKEGTNLELQGAKFDFSEFNKVVEGEPGPFFQKALARAKKFGLKDQYVLTARPGESAKAIYEFLKAMGLEIPLENITGLANSSPVAKAMWLVEKAANEGYNDFYFADDALANVQVVKDILGQLDVKSKVQQAKKAKDLFKDVNEIMEFSLGIDSKKTFSKAEALLRGSDKRKYKFFIPDSAADFELLIEPLLGKGKQGIKNREFFKENVLTPFERGINDLNKATQAVQNDYQSLRRQNKDITKVLGKEVEGTSFSHDMAIRTWIYEKAGYEIPGMAKNTKRKLVEYIEGSPELMTFAKNVSRLTKIEGGLRQPTDTWLAETIASEISTMSNSIRRADYLSEFIQNKEIVFSEANLNKMQAALGNKWREAFDGMLDRMTTGRTKPANLGRIGDGVMTYLNGSVGAIMNFNTRSGALQLISSVNFVNHSFNNPLRATAALANVPQYIKDFMTIMNSDMLVQRRSGLRINVTEAELAADAQGGLSPKKILAKILKAGYLPTKVADSFAIASGGATYYRNRIKDLMKKGMPKAEAEKKAFLDFQAIAERTQQSSRADLLSQQQVSFAGRLILPFANTPMQMNRIMKKSLQDIAKGRYEGLAGENSLTHNASKVMYYGFVQSAIFAGLQSGLVALANSDDDAKVAQVKVRAINTMADSFLRGLGIQGAVFSGLKNAFMKFVTEDKKGWGADYSEVAEELLNISPTIGSKFRKLDQAGNTHKYNKKVYSEIGFDKDNPAIDASAQLIEALTNVPVNRALTKVDNLRNAADKRYAAMERLWMFLGWNNWSLGVGVEEKVVNKGKDNEYIKYLGVQDIVSERAKEKLESDKKKKKKKQLDSRLQCSAFSRSSGRRCKNKANEGKTRCYAHD